MHKKRGLTLGITAVLVLLLSGLLEIVTGSYPVWTNQELHIAVEQPAVLLEEGFVVGEYEDQGSGISYSIEVGGGEGYNLLTEEEQKQIVIDRENQKILEQAGAAGGQQPNESIQDHIVERDGAMYRRVGRNYYTILFKQPVYIAKAVLTLPTMETGSYCYVAAKSGENTVYEIQDGYVDQRIGTRIFQPKQEIDRIQFEISNVDPIEVNAVGIQLLNEYQFNYIRFSFFLILCSIAAFMVLGKQIFRQKEEYVFLVISLLAGCLLILCVGTNQIGYDEHTHAKQAYNLSFGSTIQTTETAMQMSAGMLPTFYTLEERRLAEDYEERNNDFSRANLTGQSRFPGYDVRSYLPISVFQKLGRILDLPFAWNMMLGRLGNLLCYCAVLFLAIRFAKTGKLLITALALLPNNLFAATGLTYDAVVNAFLILAVVLTLNLIYDEKEDTNKLTWMQIFLILGAYVAGSTAKPIYIVMALMLLFLPSKRFENRWQQLGFQSAVLLLAGFMVYTIFFPPVSSHSNYELIGNLAYAGDKRNQGTSVLGQLAYIFSNFGTYLKLLFSSMLGDLADYLTGIKKFLNYGYLGELQVGWTWLTIAAVSAAALFSPKEEKRHSVGRKYILLNLSMIMGVSAIIWTSMYVSFTPVGAASILGVQARYFIPLFLPFFLCLFNSRLRIPISKMTFSKIISGILVMINLYAVWTLAVLPRNW